ncbi:hypothetical protein CASFOL_002040 [Castilleja foliolosa]|uniref:Uncharacterized protein n=1 Tax=Castilleja foliolosa TaxID=1961234 RepID=A0ABD3EGQ3_9LAMI
MLLYKHKKATLHEASNREAKVSQNVVTKNAKHLSTPFKDLSNF